MVTVNDRDGINMEKEITVIDWQSRSFHMLSNERDLWEAAAVAAINANHMHHACSLNYAMPCESLIRSTRLVSIQKEYSTDMLISILGEFLKFSAWEDAITVLLI